MSEEKPEEKRRRELEEAERIYDMRRQGMTIERISERLGMSESTVRRRIELWERTIGVQPASREESKTAATIIETVFGILGSDETAERIGEITGADAATVKELLGRILRGEATKMEISRLMSNLRGAIVGYFGGSDVMAKIRRWLPTRPEIDERLIERKAREMLASPRKKRKKKAEAA